MNDFGTFLSNFWIFLIIFFFLMPQIQKSFLEASRKSLLKRISAKRNSVVITLIHRQETIAFLGIPLSRYIDIEDSEEVLRAIREAPPDAPIDLIIHTPGGLALAATQIALALKAHPGKTTVIIPHYAMSGGTLIALAADEICMDEYAVLGPIDPQINDLRGSYPAASILKVVQTKGPEKVNDRTLILAEEAKKAMKQMENLVRNLLKDKYDKERIDRIVEELVSGKYTHDHPITQADAEKLLGVCVKKELPKEIYALMKLYRMEIKPRRPGVEFVPIMPHRP